GRDKLTISGNNLVRLVYHSSIYPSQLILKDLTLSNGHADYDIISHGDGGCIYTSGSVTLDHVTMKDCYAHGKGGGINAFDITLDHALLKNGYANHAGGGGVNGYSVTLTSSIVTLNHALGDGGGIHGTYVYLYDSAVSYNTAGPPSSNNAHGGGIH